MVIYRYYWENITVIKRSRKQYPTPLNIFIHLFYLEINAKYPDNQEYHAGILQQAHLKSTDIRNQ